MDGEEVEVVVVGEGKLGRRRNWIDMLHVLLLLLLHVLPTACLLCLHVCLSAWRLRTREGWSDARLTD